MKYITILVLALLLGACSSTKSVKEAPFTVSLESPKVELGTLVAHFDKTVALAGLREAEIAVNYYPVEDAVCLQYRIDFMTYYLFWNSKGREAYLNAIEKYKEDFNERKLKPKGNRNTRRKYGMADCYLIWQAGAFLTKSMASNVTELGYDIKNVDDKNKASFFVLYQREAVYVHPSMETERRNTASILIYLTRAKTEELAQFFDQNLLDSSVPTRIKNQKEPVPLDIY